MIVVLLAVVVGLATWDGYRAITDSSRVNARVDQDFARLSRTLDRTNAKAATNHKTRNKQLCDLTSALPKSRRTDRVRDELHCQAHLKSPAEMPMPAVIVMPSASAEPTATRTPQPGRRRSSTHHPTPRPTVTVSPSPSPSACLLGLLCLGG